MSKNQGAWRVTVRFADGSSLYYADETSRQGQQQWTPRVNQARKFRSESEAVAFAASCSTNSDAREYLVERA